MIYVYNHIHTWYMIHLATLTERNVLQKERSREGLYARYKHIKKLI